MHENSPKNLSRRLAINLEPVEDRMLIALRAAMERRLSERLTYTAVIRLLIDNAAREQLDPEEIIKIYNQ